MGQWCGLSSSLVCGLCSVPPGFIFKGATGIAGLGIGPRFVSQDLGADGAPILVAGSGAFGAVQQEGNFAQTVGSMAHEFGHALGLPDLYDTSYEVPVEDSAGIGHWGLMGWGAHGWDWLGGPVAFSAWSLEKLGWIGRGNRRLVELVGDRSGLSLRETAMKSFSNTWRWIALGFLAVFYLAAILVAIFTTID